MSPQGTQPSISPSLQGSRSLNSPATLLPLQSCLLQEKNKDVYLSLGRGRLVNQSARPASLLPCFRFHGRGRVACALQWQSLSSLLNYCVQGRLVSS